MHEKRTKGSFRALFSVITLLVYVLIKEMAKGILKLTTEWICMTTGGCLVAGIFHYLKVEKKRTDEKPIVIDAPYSSWDSNWDKRDISSVLKISSNPKNNKKLEEKKQKLVSTARRHIFLIRHGQYHQWKEDESGRRLTDLGVEQAKLVGKRLKDLDLNFTKLVHSTLIRAIETADEIAKLFPWIDIKSCHLLREGDPIPTEPPVGHWKEEYKYFQDGPRIEAAFRHHFHRAPPEQKEDSYEIIVCHANVIRYFICRLLQFPPEAWLRFSLYHCSITHATILPNGVVFLSAIGDHGFMPTDKLSKK